MWDVPRVSSSFNVQKEMSLITNMFGKYCLLRTKKACPIQPEGHGGSGSGDIFNGRESLSTFPQHLFFFSVRMNEYQTQGKHLHPD